MKTIEISDRAWQKLQEMAVPFVDKEPKDVVDRMLFDASEHNRMQSEVQAANPTLSINRKAHGENLRNQYLETLKLEGKALRPVHGGLFVSKTGKQWKIQTATERRKGRWFLGTPAAHFEGSSQTGLILVCSEGDSHRDFIISPGEMKQLAQKLAKVNGHLKFNVVTRGQGLYEL